MVIKGPDMGSSDCYFGAMDLSDSVQTAREGAYPVQIRDVFAASGSLALGSYRCHCSEMIEDEGR